MGPLFFQSLPEIFSYGLAVAMVQVCILLLVTGKRFLKQVSITVSALVGAVLGETVAISLNADVAWLGIGAGIVGGALIGRYLRPAGVGLALSYLAFSAAGNLANVAYLGWVAALVIFAYGLLLTDLAPTFVSSLLSCSILVLNLLFCSALAAVEDYPVGDKPFRRYVAEGRDGQRITFYLSTQQAPVILSR
jgi:hypothetical protein